jgi:hypothetical protein
MSNIAAWFAYIVSIAIMSLPLWVALEVSNVDVPFLVIAAVLFTHHISSSFLRSAYKSAERGKRALRDLDLSRWS